MVVNCATPFCTGSAGDKSKPLPFQPGGGSSKMTDATFCKPSSRNVIVDPGCRKTVFGCAGSGVVGLIDSVPMTGGKDGFATGGIVGGAAGGTLGRVVGSTVGRTAGGIVINSWAGIVGAGTVEIAVVVGDAPPRLQPSAAAYN